MLLINIKNWSCQLVKGMKKRVFCNVSGENIDIPISGRNISNDVPEDMSNTNTTTFSFTEIFLKIS